MTEERPKSDWSMVRQSVDTTYIYFQGQWVATVRPQYADRLLEVLRKQD